MTAVAAKSLTDERPNIFTEKIIVLKSLFSLRSIKLKEKDKTRRYSSVLFGNIDRMSKIVKLSDDASVTDGVFEMNAIRFRSKLRLLGYIITAAALGLPRKKLRSYTCVTKKALPMQMDGEVYLIDAGSIITVRSRKQLLRCVL